jgi:alcohol dehydrogenase/L-iditol 2-dehydrogenase
VLIFGPGPIGLLCLALAKLSGAGWTGVVGLKQDEGRLAIAKSMGADGIITGAGPELQEVVRSIPDGWGVNVVIEASGASAALKPAMAAVRPGGQITKVGWGPQPLDFSLDPLVQKAVNLQGSFSHNFAIWESVISLFASGRLNPMLIVGRAAPLDGWRECFEAMAEGKIVKAVLKPDYPQKVAGPGG